MAFLWKGFQKTGLVIRWLIFLILLNVGFSICLRLAGNVETPTSVRYMKSLSFKKASMADSWEPMSKALEYLDKNPKGPVYDEVLYKKIGKFQYPPTSLLIFELPRRITGWSYWRIAYMLDRISWFCVFLIGLISARILILLLKAKQFSTIQLSAGIETTSVYFLVCFLTLLYYPITFSYNLGQIQTLLTLLGALSMLYWMMEKKYLSGLLIGLICLIKPQLALILIWAAVRKQWKMVLAAAAVILPFLLISIWFYGLKNHLEYLSVLSFLSHHGESYYPNQSANGLMNRLLFNGNNLTWSMDFPAYSPLVYGVTMVFAIVLILPALFWNYKRKNPDVMDMGIMILATTMASPIAWEHHYGMVFPIFIVLMPFAAILYKNKKWELLLLSFAYTLTAQIIQFVQAFAGSRLNILQSYLFFGACIILLYLYRVSYMRSQTELVRQTEG
jgi:alpha-1,2-mannosyltransferase